MHPLPASRSSGSRDLAGLITSRRVVHWRSFGGTLISGQATGLSLSCGSGSAGIWRIRTLVETHDVGKSTGVEKLLHHSGEA